MAETTIILGDWNSVTPAAPGGSPGPAGDNITFQVDRTGSIPKFSAWVPRADVGGDYHGTILYDGSGNASRYLGADGSWHDVPGSPSPQTLSIVTGHVALDYSLGIYYILATGGAAFTLDNPTNPTSGKAILIKISGAGVIILDSKFNARGATLTRSSGTDYLGIVYDAAADTYDCWWSQDA